MVASNSHLPLRVKENQLYFCLLNKVRRCSIIYYNWVVATSATWMDGAAIVRGGRCRLLAPVPANSRMMPGSPGIVVKLQFNGISQDRRPSREFIAVRIAAPVDAFHHVCRKPNHNARWAPRAASIQACLPCVRLWQRAQRGWMAYIVVYSGSLYTASSRLPHVTCRCLPSCLS